MDLTGWTPARMFRDEASLVEWVYTGSRRFVEPFWKETLDGAVRDPFSLLFQRATSLSELVEWHERRPGLEPTGFVFHLSRCGSTLLTQMLAVSPRFRVLSEPGPVDAVLRADAPLEERALWLRALVSALGQALPGEEELVLKLDSWSVLHLDVVAAAFPRTPWIFLHRDPLEVLTSQLGHAGAHAVPGVLPAGLFGLDPRALASMSRPDYIAHVLAAILGAALRHAGHPNGRYVAYRELPDFVVSDLPGHFRFTLSEAERRAMRAAAQLDAKNPALPFEPDSARKQAAATPEARRANEAVLRPVYDRLLAC